ncbi:MAG TPA: amidohydrolase [Polyangiaceae bacterium]|nr:amidohydrolase [Polyangiaceae bacterium]
MRPSFRLGLAALALASLFAGACAPPEPPGPPSRPASRPASRAAGAPVEAAELVLSGGPVLGAGGATALALRGGRIVGVGDAASIARFRGPGTRSVELGGRSAVVALTDAHAHVIGLGLRLDEADLRGCATADECAARAAAHRGGRGGWALGGGWDQNRFPDKALPHRRALDAALPDRPAWFERVDGHAGWANSAALKAANVTRATPDPPGGRILRDAKGEPTGVLVDTAMALVERAVPPPDEAAREQAIERAQALALSKGLTEVHDMGLSADEVATFRRLEREGRLKLRVVGYASGRGEAERAALFARRPDPPRPGAVFRLGGIKLYADGALGSYGAALLEPYADQPELRGLVLTDPSALEDAARKALASGWQLAVHAIGDRANRTVLDAFERAGCRRERDVRFRIEHAQIVDPADLPRFAALGVLASVQPTHATSDMPWAPTRLGPKRLAGAYPYRSLLAGGARLPAGSDAPVEAIDPAFGLYAFVTRQDPKGQPPGGWLPAERLRLDEALRAFTEEAAFAAFEERWRGRAAEGMAADVTVFDRRLDEADPASIRDAKVAMTIVGGAIVFAP